MENVLYYVSVQERGKTEKAYLLSAHDFMRIFLDISFPLLELILITFIKYEIYWYKVNHTKIQFAESHVGPALSFVKALRLLCL
jgi:hypothetical protein